MEKRGTPIPAHLAVRKWPNSWTKTSTPRTRMVKRRVCIRLSLHHPRSPGPGVCEAGGARSRPCIRRKQILHRARGRRLVLGEHALGNRDDLEETDATIEEGCHRDLV